VDTVVCAPLFNLFDYSTKTGVSCQPVWSTSGISESFLKREKLYLFFMVLKENLNAADILTVYLFAFHGVSFAIMYF
jgi:hypothetical protein